MTKFNYSKFFRSFKYAGRGLLRFFATEQNARVQLIIASIAAAMAIGFHINHIEMAVLFFAFVLVFGMEITNTAIEKLLDIVHPENHDQIGYIKDALAGSVLIACIIAAVIFFLMFYPYVHALV